MVYRKKAGNNFTKKHIAVFLTPVFVFIFYLISSFFYGGNFFEYTPIVSIGANTSVLVEPQKKIITYVKTPDSVKGIYMTSWVASTNDFRNELVNLIKGTELNSIIIDIKDYTGKIAFEVSDPKLKEIGSAENRVRNIGDFLESLHKENIYVIGRIAVFQDPYLVGKRPDLAVKKTDGKTVWKDYKGAVWLSPCSKEAWDYAINIAKEARAVGFDEINFDYIRFPSDGNMKDISYPFCEAGVSKADSMEEFFAYLKDGLNELNMPVSADLFGMTTVNADDLNIGQVMEKADPYFDFIMPMVYPSHYPKGYNGYANPAAHPYEIIKLGMDTASKRLLVASSTPSKLRPWLQDFDLGAIYDAGMIRKQKQAVYDAGLSSWFLWSPSNKYTAEALDASD